MVKRIGTTTMARALDRLFTVEDWASFEGEPDTRYELFDGRLVAMAPPKSWHGDIVIQLGAICRDDCVIGSRAGPARRPASK